MNRNAKQFVYLGFIFFLNLIVLPVFAEGQKIVYDLVLKEQTPKAKEVLATALRIQQSSQRLKSPKMSAAILTEILTYAFQDETIKVDELIDVELFLRITGKDSHVKPIKGDHHE